MLDDGFICSWIEQGLFLFQGENCLMQMHENLKAGKAWGENSGSVSCYNVII